MAVTRDESASQEPPEEERTAKLLFVDDEQNILSSLKRVFRSQGYEILTATSGAEGLALMEQQPVDLVISDMRMPQMDGAQFLAAVAERWPETVRMLLTGYADLNSTVDAINKGRIYGYFSKPWEDNEIRLTVQHAIERKFLEQERRRLQELTRKQNAELQELNATLEKRVQARTEELEQTNMFLELAYKQLKESYYDAIPIFANLVQLREGPAGGHSKRVAELAKEVAEELQFDEDDVRHVYFAGLLHDIGKMGLPDELLKMPYFRMNPEQRKLMERHPNIGAAVLMGLEPLQKTALFIRQHHEAFDGKGYPNGLIGNEIAPGSRVLMACNDYDGLRHGTLLGDDLSLADAMDYMRERGARYDGEVLEALFTVLRRREAGREKVREHRLEPAALRPGMRLSRDLLSGDEVLLLSREHILHEKLIDKIQAFARDFRIPLIIHVYAEEGEIDESNHAGG